jgi:hypothetical protein
VLHGITCRCAGRVHCADGALGLGQEHAAQHPGPAGAHDVRQLPAGRRSGAGSGRCRPDAAPAQHAGLCVPVPPPAARVLGAGERHAAGPHGRGPRQHRAARPCAQPAGCRGPGAGHGQAPGGAVGRHAAARGHCARAGHEPAAGAGRRAHGQPGHRLVRRSVCPAAPHPRRARHELCGRHARPAPGGALRPAGGADRRPHCARRGSATACCRQRRGAPADAAGRRPAKAPTCPGLPDVGHRTDTAGPAAGPCAPSHPQQARTAAP